MFTGNGALVILGLGASTFLIHPALELMAWVDQLLNVTLEPFSLVIGLFVIITLCTLNWKEP